MAKSTFDCWSFMGEGGDFTFDVFLYNMFFFLMITLAKSNGIQSCHGISAVKAKSMRSVICQCQKTNIRARK